MRFKLPTKEERKANVQFHELVARLSNGKEAERRAAAEELRKWPDAMERLLAGYRFTTNLWKYRWRLSLYSLVVLLTGNIVIGVFIFRGFHIIFPLLQLLWWPLWAVVVLVCNGGKMCNGSVRRLLIFEDVKIVGPLVDALGFRDEITQKEARQALIGLLPRLQASDANLLNAEQREQLRQVLFTDYKPLAVSVLKAYQHIGDGAELAAVERLMQMPLWDVEMREAAEACLPFLQLRAQQMQSSQTLLRASEPVTTPDVLLRPAAHSHRDNETQLLRMSGK